MHALDAPIDGKCTALEDPISPILPEMASLSIISDMPNEASSHFFPTERSDLYKLLRFLNLPTRGKSLGKLKQQLARFYIAQTSKGNIVRIWKDETGKFCKEITRSSGQEQHSTKYHCHWSLPWWDLKSYKSPKAKRSRLLKSSFTENIFDDRPFEERELKDISTQIETIVRERGDRQNRKKEQSTTDMALQPFEYYLVFDVEATCDDAANPWTYPNEIIEFPVVLIDSVSRKVVDEFHSFVRPSFQPILTDFCKRLTGIQQKQVDSAPSFLEVVIKFENWLSRYSEPPFFKECIFVTDGPWDIRDFIGKQLALMPSTLQRPSYFYEFINLRELFEAFYASCGKSPGKRNLEGMLTYLNLEFEGRQHSGLDDARNIARIVLKLMEEGCILDVNWRINVKKKG